MQTLSSVVHQYASVVLSLFESACYQRRMNRSSVLKRPSGCRKDQNIDIAGDFIDECCGAFDCIKGAPRNPGPVSVIIFLVILIQWNIHIRAIQLFETVSIWYIPRQLYNIL